MTKTLKDIFKEFEDKVVRLEEIIVASNGLTWNVDLTDLTRRSAVNNFSLVKGFIKAQPLENQRDLWLTIIDLLKDSKVFDDMFKEEIRKELLLDCFKELENLNYTILQSHTQKNTVKGNAKKANKPDTTVKGNAKKANKPDAKFNWQGEQTQLVYLIEQLYEQGFLSPISQAEKHRLTAQHFTVKGESLNPRNLAKAKQSYLNNKGGKPKRGEEIEQIVSAAKNQNPSKT
jgi:hypothetical protein